MFDCDVSNDFIIIILQFIFQVSVETPEMEQPPSLPQPETSEESIDIIIDSTEPEVPKIQMTEKENCMTNGDLPTPRQSPIVTPTPTPGPSSAPTPAPAPRSGLNESLTKGSPDRASTGGNIETVSTYINGGIINKRYSYSGSMVSESMDMSINRETISMSARVSQHKAKQLQSLVASKHPDLTCNNIPSVFLLKCQVENSFT